MFYVNELFKDNQKFENLLKKYTINYRNTGLQIEAFNLGEEDDEDEFEASSPKTQLKDHRRKSIVKFMDKPIIIEELKAENES